MRKNKKKIIILAIVIVLVIVLVVTLVYKAKTGRLPFTSNVEEFKEVAFVENKNMKVTVSNVSTTDNYMLIEYDIDVKDEAGEDFGMELNTMDGYDYILEREVKVNGTAISNMYSETEQMAYKESENKIKVYDIIDISDKDISGDYKLQIDIYDYPSEDAVEEEDTTENETVEDEAEEDTEDIEEVGEEETEEEIIDEEETTDEEVVEDEDIEIEDLTEDEVIDTEETDEDLYEEVTGEYEDVETTDEPTTETTEDSEDTDEVIENDFSGLDFVGTIQKKLNRDTTNGNATENSGEHKYEQDGITMTIKNTITTGTAKFIIVNTDLTGVSSDLDTDDLSNSDNFNINVQDENGNSIAVNKVQSLTTLDEENTASLTTIIGLIGDNANLNKIKLQPYFCGYIGEKTEEEINSKTWYTLDTQTATNTNQYGGTVEVTKVETDEDIVKVYFKQNGFIPVEEPIIIFRKTDAEEFYYLQADVINKVSSDEYVAEATLVEDPDYEEALTDASTTHFAIFEDITLKVMGEGYLLEL